MLVAKNTNIKLGESKEFQVWNITRPLWCVLSSWTSYLMGADRLGTRNRRPRTCCTLVRKQVCFYYLRFVCLATTINIMERYHTMSHGRKVKEETDKSVMRPAMGKRITSWDLDVKVAGSNLLNAGQLPHMATLYWPRSPSGRMMHIILIIKEVKDKTLLGTFRERLRVGSQLDVWEGHP